MASEPNRSTLRQIDRLFQGGTVTGLDQRQLWGGSCPIAMNRGWRPWSTVTARWCWASVDACSTTLPTSMTRSRQRF